MTVLLERPIAVVAVVADERRARRDLRAQIARLECRGARAPASSRGPRLLSLGELEAVRDALIGSVAATGSPPAPDGQGEARVRLERMIADPAAHRRERVALAELGLPGCGTYRVRPRLGLVGMLAGWWRVTVSSGCP